MRRKIITFDIFDTLFLRACGEPSGIYTITAYKVFGEQVDSELVREFVYARKMAEILAVKKAAYHGLEDVTIIDIYDNFTFLKNYHLDTSEVMNTEMTVEKNNLVPVRKMQEFIRSIRDDNTFIGFISDMYLPSSFLKDLLRDYGYFEDGDILLVSSEIKKKKCTGTIFKELSNALGIPLSKCKWSHYGDNIISDGIKSIQNGAKSHIVTYTDTPYQRYIKEKDIDLYNQPLHQLASLQKAVLFKYGYNSTNMILTDLMLPLILPSAFYILKDAKKRNIKKLYFFSRDSFYLYQIAKKITESNQYFNITCKYLRVSRKVLYLPNITNLTVENLSRYVKFLSRPVSVFTALEHYGLVHLLSDEQMGIEGLKEENLDDDKKKQVLQALLDDKVFYQRACEVRDAQRSNLLGYLKQEGIIDKHVAFVDMSGTRKSQVALNDLLQPILKYRLHGYYVANFGFSVAESESGPYTCILLQGWKECDVCGNLLEDFYSLTDQGRTIGYVKENSLYKATTEVPIISKSQSAHINNVQDILFTSLDLFIKNELFRYNDTLLNIGILINSKFAKQPHEDYLSTLSQFIISETESKKVPFISNLTLADIKNIIDRKEIITSAWKVGSICKYFPLGKFIIVMFNNRGRIRYIMNLIIYKIYSIRNIFK